MCVTIKSPTSSIMDLSEKNYQILLCLHSSICKYRLISTKHGHNIYEHKIWNEFDYGSSRPEQLELHVFALELGRTAEFDFVYTLDPTNIIQSATNLVKMYVTIRSWISLIMDLIGPKQLELSALQSEKLPYLTLFTL